MAAKKKQFRPTPIFLSRDALVREYRLTKTDKKVLKSVRRKSKAVSKPLTPDVRLAAVIGSSSMPRNEATKKIWAYIKRNGLLDKKNRGNINADDKLKPVFGGKGTVSMFEMTKLIGKHLK